MWNKVETYRTSDNCENCSKDKSLQNKIEKANKEAKIREEVIKSLREKVKKARGETYIPTGEASKGGHFTMNIVLVAICSICLMIGINHFNDMRIFVSCLVPVVAALFINRFSFHYFFEKRPDSKTNELFIQEIINRVNQQNI